MGAARDTGLNTRLLLLLEIHNGRHTRLKTLAGRLGVTVQAVSETLRRMTDEDLVHNEDGVWKPTAQGTERLHRSFLDLRRIIDEAMEQLTIIDECVALASTDVTAGANVGLYMDLGHLWAEPGRRSHSRGEAASNAKKGELVRVRRLRGIVDLKPGTVTVLTHPALPTADEVRRLAAALKAASAQLLAVHDTAARAVAGRLDRRPDVEFAPLEATLDAVRRGLSVAYLVPSGEAPGLLAELAAAKDASGEPVRVRSVET